MLRLPPERFPAVPVRFSPWAILKQHPVWVCLLAGLLLRAAFFIELRHSPFYHSPSLDPLEYDDWAREIAAGKILWTSIPIHGPGYPFFLAGIYALSGGSYAAVYLVQLALGLLNVFLVWRLGLNCFDRAAAFAAALFAALLWTPVYFEGLLMPPPLLLTLDLAALLGLDFGRRTGRLWPWLAGGIFLGLSAITWPIILVFVVGLFFWLLLFPPKPLTRPAILPALFVLVGAGLCIAPVAYQNVRAGRDFVLVQKNGGLNFYLGNNPDADGTPNVRPTGDWDRLITKPILEAKAYRPSEQDRFFISKVEEFARAEPGRFFHLQARKAALLLNAREVRATFDPEFFRRQYRSLSLPWPGFGLLLPLALLGMILLRPPVPSLLLLYLALNAAALVATVVSARYRMPLVPALALFAGNGLIELGRMARALELRRLALSLLFLLAAGLAVHCPYPVPRHGNAEEHYHVGNAYYARGNLYAAEVAYRNALAEDPGFSLALGGLAMIAWEQGDHERALALFRRALEVDPDNIPVRARYADRLREAGEGDAALAQYQSILKLWPVDAASHLGAAMIYWQKHDLVAARESLRQAVAYEPDNLEAHLAFARLAGEQGDSLTARREAEAALQLQPDSRAAKEILSQLPDHERREPPELR